MAEFRIEIAGKVAAVSSMFESTRDYCRCYLTEKAPDLSIAVTREDLGFEQNWLREEARQEGLRPRVFSEPFLERAAIQRKLAEYLFGHGILMLHGSAVAADGEGYLFTAKCGTGKSTHTRLWREVLGDRAVMVNDDKPFLKITDHGVGICGSPWSGKHGLDTNITVPLKGICILQRGKENRIRRLEPEEALPMLLQQSYQPLDPDKQPELRKLLETLAEKTALWRMECTKDPQAAVTAFAAMSAEKTNDGTEEQHVSKMRN